MGYMLQPYRRGWGAAYNGGKIIVKGTVHTEWRMPISGVPVHPIVMENQPWLVRLGGARPPSFSLTYKLQLTLQLRWQIHSLYFISTLYLCTVLCDRTCCSKGPKFLFENSNFLELVHPRANIYRCFYTNCVITSTSLGDMKTHLKDHHQKRLDLYSVPDLAVKVCADPYPDLAPDPGF
jgi:hypothetical protein